MSHDVLHAGTVAFEKNVIKPIKEAFEFGSEEADMFRYVGMNFNQMRDGIWVDQEHYVQALELPDMNVAADIEGG